MDNFRAVKTAFQSGTNASDIIRQPGNVFHDKVHVKDKASETSSDSPSDEDGSSGLEDENTSTNDCNTDGSTAVASKCLQKSATFPVSAGLVEDEPEANVVDTKVYDRSLSLPVVRKLVSAMKGGRVKEGVVPSQKLSVSWAPDVYDPLPTSVSHFPRKRSQQQYSKNHKKHGKGKQKGKNTRGGCGGGNGSKDKKHSRKSSGKSDRSLDSCSDSNRVHEYKSSLEILDFTEPGVVGPSMDGSCGSKFLGQASGGTMHCVY